MVRKRWPVLIVLATFLGGCSAMQPKDFEGAQPHLNLFAYFQGDTRAWGIFQDLSLIHI